MNETLKNAAAFLDSAIQHFDRAGGDGSTQLLEMHRRIGREDLELATAAAAIAQAEAAERQADAMEKIARLLDGAIVNVQDGEKAIQTLDYFESLRQTR